MKTRFTSLDVAAIVADLQSLIGLRLANIYDSNPKTFILKFAKPDFKALVLIESGIRVHPTNYAREKSNTPSNFNAKLRKHLKTRRLSSVKQLGVDRIIDFTFGEDEFAYHLFVELYSSGNIILTGHDHVILAVLRVVDVETNALSGASAPATTATVADVRADAQKIDKKEAIVKKETKETAKEDGKKDENEKVEINFRVGQRYTMVDFVRSFNGLNRDGIIAALDEYRKSVPAGGVDEEVDAVVPDEPATTATVSGGKSGKSTKAAKTQKKKDKKAKQSGGGKDVTLRKWAKEKFGFLYGPALVDHALSFGSVLDTTIKMSEVVGDDSTFESVVDALTNGFGDANRIMDLAFEGKHAFEGWITQVEHKGATLPNSESTQDTLIIYDEFHPYNFSQLAQLPADPPILHHNTFSKCVDEFFTHTESHRLQLRLHAAETTASKKLASVSQSHTAQVTRLQTATQQSAKVAACIESNLEVVDAVINTVRQFVASGMDWVELWELVKEEARMGNYVASVITGLKLEVGVVSVGLLDPEFVDEEADAVEDEDSEEESDSDDDADVKAARGRKRAEKAKLEKEREKRRRENTLKIDLDIYLSAWGNARRYYDSKKLAAVKAEKTIHAVGKALKQAEKKITQDLKATKSAAPMIKTIRTPYWFEKYNWFISSENYLVVSGRDSAQTDVLLRKYMRKDDVLVCADVEGAPAVLVINSFSAGFGDVAGARPPGLTPEAPIPPLTLHQAGTMTVAHSKAWESKIITSAWWVRGDVVMKAGGIAPLSRGDKNYLPPVQLIYGFGLLFAVDEESSKRHFDERRPWTRFGDVVVPETDGTALVDLDENEADGNEGKEDSEEDEPIADQDPESVVVNFDKYQLEKPHAIESIDEPDVAIHEVPTEAVTNKNGNEKRKLSAKERRELKKGVPPHDVMVEPTESESVQDQNSQAESDDDNESNNDETVAAQSFVPVASKSKLSTPSIASKSSTNQPSAPRGKKGKLKKMKDKYADQSDEEREVMMALLHGSESSAKKKKGGAEDVKPGKGKAKQPAPKGTPNKDAKKVAPPKPKTTAIAGGEFLGENTAPEEFSLSVLDSLTSQPHPDDVLIAAIPVCLPWTCLAKYKYKVKLVPGALKKGKAAKSVESAFKSMSASTTKREADVISIMNEAEFVAAMLGKVKVMGTSNSLEKAGKRK